MFYAIIKINFLVDVTKFEEIALTKPISQCTSIAIVDSLQDLRKATLKLIPMPSSTFIACVIENKKPPLHIIKYTDPNNIIRGKEFTWMDCADKLILSTKSPSLKEGIYTKTHQTLNSATSIFYGKTSKDHLPESLETLELTECLEVGRDCCSGDICYQDLNYYHQPRIFDCADTAMKMLIDYHIQKCNELKDANFSEQRNDLKSNYERRPIKLFSGKTSAELKSYSDFLNKVDLKEKGNRKEYVEEVLPGHLTYYLYKYGPLIMRTNEIGGHFVVVKGMVNNQVLIDDPWAGSNMLVKFDDFNKKWDGTIVYFSAGYSKYLEKTTILRNDLSSQRIP
ncbi:cysteine peptidase family C39 domain-containing protein [Legionella sp. D16C41]|uniref:cysteine peptidase family C39 domain-containing protein n=1 Tax=Legionella sp. D16C41 TaxID=3402688 RepID=UPI003AF606F0